MLSSNGISSDLSTDELYFAQLACLKLAKRLQGTLSVGLPALVTGVPDPEPFFEGCFRVLDALAVVLGTVAGKPAAGETIRQLKQYSDQLQEELRRLQLGLVSARRAMSENTPDPLQHAKDAASRTYEILDLYAGLVKLDAPVIAEMKAAVLPLFDTTLSLTATFQS